MEMLCMVDRTGAVKPFSFHAAPVGGRGELELAVHLQVGAGLPVDVQQTGLTG